MDDDINLIEYYNNKEVEFRKEIDKLNKLPLLSHLKDYQKNQILWALDKFKIRNDILKLILKYSLIFLFENDLNKSFFEFENQKLIFGQSYPTKLTFKSKKQDVGAAQINSKIDQNAWIHLKVHCKRDEIWFGLASKSNFQYECIDTRSPDNSISQQGGRDSKLHHSQNKNNFMIEIGEIVDSDTYHGSIQLGMDEYRHLLPPICDGDQVKLQQNKNKQTLDFYHNNNFLVQEIKFSNILNTNELQAFTIADYEGDNFEMWLTLD